MSAALDQVMVGFGDLIIALLINTGIACFVDSRALYLTITEPEGNIDTLYLLDVILVLEGIGSLTGEIPCNPS